MLFGNILDRAPGHALELLEGKRQELLQQCGRDDSKKRKAPDSKISIKDVGPEFKADCVELLHGSLPNRRLLRDIASFMGALAQYMYNPTE